MKDCIFCRIASSGIGKTTFYETEFYVAFLDVNPLIIGHSLLVPKRHAGTIYDLNEEEQNELGKVIYDVSRILKKKFGSSINISNTSGEHASQSVPHFHFHLIPRREKDRLWDGDNSRIVLDRSSGFPRLKPSSEELMSLVEELKVIASD